MVDPNRDGDVDWRLDPFSHPTWLSDFQSGDWIEMLVSGYYAGGPDARAYLARANALTQSWLRGVPVQDRNPGALICLSEAFPGQARVQDQIPPAVDYYAAHWQGAWNHGLQQDLELLKIGCSYPAGSFGGAALRWRQTAVRQMISAFEPNPLGPSIDAKGVVNEQATLYEDFVYRLWITRGLPELAACGYQLPGWITARIARMPAFLAEATQPDGNLAQIGDTYVEHPVTSPPQPNLVAVYQAGYVFGQSGWGPGASFYSLRFGAGRCTVTRITWASPTTPAAGTSSSTRGTPATRTRRTAPDTAFGGHPRYRGVYASQRPDLVVVFDRASGAGDYQQLWHLDPALNVTTVTGTAAIASAPGTALELLRIPLPGQAIAPGAIQVVRGQVSPYQGWVSRQMLRRLPADVVEMTRYGSSAAMLTLIVPTAPGTPVTTAITGPPGGPYQLTAHVGGATATFAITAAGVISQGTA